LSSQLISQRGGNTSACFGYPKEVNILKKPFPRIILLLLGLIFGVALSSVIFVTTGFSLFGDPIENPQLSDNINNANLATLAFDVLEYIRESDFTALSKVAHPDFGVVFSPTATVTLSTNRRFSAEQIAMFDSDNTIYVWGVYCNGNIEPIELTPIDYFAEFVFPRDYADSSIIGIDHIIRSGNALENITEEFPGIRFVDFHIPGGEPDSPDDTDWSSLRLGFEEHEGRLWLTAVILSTWTV